VQKSFTLYDLWRGRSALVDREKLVLLLVLACPGTWPQQIHDHPAPSKLGRVSFPISCVPRDQAAFNRGVALLHSFAYSSANLAFRQVAADDPGCAMAHWGVAMSCFHQLWEPSLVPACLPASTREIEAAQKLGSSSARERGYIQALSIVYRDAGSVPFSTRDQQYEQAMARLARDYPDDIEAQVFYALALLSNASLADKTHARQKQALAILEPLDKTYPDHPGITHYIIHACDSAELAPRGLSAARKYAQVAPDAPHALHMPSHIFTRLGLWQDSIASNLAASKAARDQGDTGEELHAMDYLAYAYLQLGRFDDARQVLDQLNSMTNLGVGDFKIGYGATAIPVRYAVEQGHWDDAAKIQAIPGSPSHVAAVAVWARGLGRTRGRHAVDASSEIEGLQKYEDELQRSGNEYWAAQVHILQQEVAAWALQANAKPQEAEALMRKAADEEDATEKSPATPGPVVPAREQLGELLLEQHRPSEAAVAFRASLVNAPNRRGAVEGLSQAMQTVSKSG
jgi:tetratricopeptide (TPR) repeat protein